MAKARGNHKYKNLHQIPLLVVTSKQAPGKGTAMRIHKKQKKGDAKSDTNSRTGKKGISQKVAR